MERRSRHFGDSQTILVSWKENSAIYRRLGNVSDVGLEGLSVLMDRAIQIGTPVTISRLSFLDFASRGIVNRLAKRSDRYVIGIVELALANNTAPLRFQSERRAA